MEIRRSVCLLSLLFPLYYTLSSAGSWKKQREFQKNIYFCFIEYAKAFDCVDHNKLWKILKEMRIPDHLTCLLRNLYSGLEATVRTGHGTTDSFQIGKGVCQGFILKPWLFNFYAEYIMRNAGLEEAQAGIKIAGRNINNFRYADDTTLMAESEEELKRSWWWTGRPGMPRFMGLQRVRHVWVTELTELIHSQHAKLWLNRLHFLV